MRLVVQSFAFSRHSLRTINSKVRRCSVFLARGGERESQNLRPGSVVAKEVGSKSKLTQKSTTVTMANAAAKRKCSFNSGRSFKKTVHGDLLLVAKEAAFAYRSAVHNLSCETAECSSKLISKFIEPKFSLTRRKNEAIISNAIVPLAEEELKRELMETHFVSITVHTSNQNDAKIMPVIVRFFLPEGGVKVKLLDFQAVPGDTAEIRTNCLLATVRKYNLPEKIVAYCGDNCNTHVEGLMRKWENDVVCCLKNELGKNLVGVGCGTHIVHNCLQSAVDALSIDVEIIVAKIYKYIHIYSVSVTELEEFCEFAETEYRKLLKQKNVHFISLLPAIERILQSYEELKSYFGSEESCPLLIERFFESKRGEMYLWFVRGQLGLFSQVISAMEKPKATASEIVLELDKLKENLKARRKAIFTPQGAKEVLRVLVEEGECQEDEIKEEFSAFYDRCLFYLEMWENSFGGGEHFVWVADSALTWPDIEATAERINETVGNAVISVDDLFDEVVVIKDIWSSRCAEHNKMECEEKWVRFFSHLKDRRISVPNLRKVVEYIFCLPGNFAPVERVISTMNSIWSEEGGRMDMRAAKGLLFCKLNIDLSCSEFYDKIKTSKQFLEKVRSSVKNERSQPGTSTTL